MADPCQIEGVCKCLIRQDLQGFLNYDFFCADGGKRGKSFRINDLRGKWGWRGSSMGEFYGVLCEVYEGKT